MTHWQLLLRQKSSTSRGTKVAILLLGQSRPKRAQWQYIPSETDRALNIAQTKPLLNNLKNFTKPFTFTHLTPLGNKRWNFLTCFGCTPLSESEASDLEEPISGDELERAMKVMKPGKRPGPDGFTLQYYCTFLDILKPRFISAFRTLASSSPRSPTLLLITVILKEGKDSTLVTNYHPISLLNVDVKLYAKILGNHLLPHMSSLISLDQVGFIPGW